jgi:acyl carrier protein
MSDSRNRILEIVRDIRGTDIPAISDSDPFIQSVGLDSLQIIAFIVKLEGIFGVRFGGSPADFGALETLGSLNDWLKRAA